MPQKKQEAGQGWPIENVERRATDELVPYARNARTHSDEQVDQIAASIAEWGWTMPVLIDEGGVILAGHGRVLAARRLKIDEVPVIVAKGWTEPQRRAYVLADNQLALASGWNDDLLKLELQELEEVNFDLNLLGWGAELPEFEEMPDYAALAPAEEELKALESGVLRALQIEFKDGDYEDARELCKWWRQRGAYLGGLILDQLRIAKEAAERELTQ